MGPDFLCTVLFQGVSAAVTRPDFDFASEWNPELYTGYVNVGVYAIILIAVSTSLSFLTKRTNETLRQSIAFLTAQDDEKFKSRIASYNKLVAFNSSLLLYVVCSLMTTFCQVQ